MACVDGTDHSRRFGDELGERSATTGRSTPDGHNYGGWIP
jgi:hypothetical protein